MSRRPGDIVKSQLTDLPPDPDARPATPKPTTPSGVRRGHALYDTPEPGEQSAEFRSGRRKCRSTEHGDWYRDDESRKANIRNKKNDTRQYNASLRTRIEEPPKRNKNQDDGKVESLPEAQPRRPHKGKAARDLPRSPTPGSTDHEQEPDPPTQQQTSGSQYTYVYETLDHDGLVKYAQEKLRFDLSKIDTQAILALLRLAEGQQATQVGSARQPATIDFQPGAPLQVGGGWHLESTSLGTGSSGPRRTKRGSDTVDTSQGSSKRQCVKPGDDTATESESEDEEEMRRHGPARVAAMRIIESCHSGTLPVVPQPSVSGTCAPPPTREVTPDTVVASAAPSRTQSFGATLSQPGQPMPPLPMIFSPPRGPVHARLRAKVLDRYLDRVDQDIKAAEAKAAEAKAAKAAAPNPDEVDELEPTDTEEVPETEANGSVASWHTLARKPQSTPAVPPAPAPAPAPAPNQNKSSRRTYGATRSHAPLLSNAKATGSNTIEADDPDSDDPGPIPRPNSPGLTTADLIRRERTRAVAAKVEAEMRALAAPRPHARRLFAEASKPPVSRPQTRPPPGATADVPGAHTRGTRRLDPVSAARADMLNFNKAVEQERATSFVQSVTRQSEHKARCAPPASRLANDLLEDDEELLVQAEAYAKSSWPSSPPSRGRNRKKKPLARDVSGVERQVLVIAKIHLYAYALVEGIYQMRATFLRWAAAVYYATWMMELPDTPYIKPPHEYLEIMVNNLATARGKAKELMRPFTESVHQFVHRLLDQQMIQENLNRFNLVYPQNFHCLTYCPRKGHYESPDIAHAIAVTFFQGPSSVGMMFPDYFRDMPLTAVAFVLAIWQFCIEEWSNGWHQNGDLGMAAMREKYEAQLAGLKELRQIAPKRMLKLQKKWREYVQQYSGVSFEDPEKNEVGGSRPSEMRPDTPDPEEMDMMETQDRMSVEELNNQLFETARQESLRERMREIVDREEQAFGAGAPMFEDEDEDGPRAPTPHSVHSRSPSPALVEFNEHGQLTARSKGKGRAH
ncbi:hypothetical protein FS749_003142 [Ceratobasidium sp. UAMH 11750]|nr:hypothetical protein FS749_003142 [Ceratobasidium sp. UAMH 11750]